MNIIVMASISVISSLCFAIENYCLASCTQVVVMELLKPQNTFVVERSTYT